MHTEIAIMIISILYHNQLKTQIIPLHYSSPFMRLCALTALTINAVQFTVSPGELDHILCKNWSNLESIFTEPHRTERLSS